jgi:hypothetical protein
MGVKPNIELHIEELVLHGLPATAAESIRAALESRLSAEGLQAGQDVHIDRLDAGTVPAADVGTSLHGAIRSAK